MESDEKPRTIRLIESAKLTVAGKHRVAEKASEQRRLTFIATVILGGIVVLIAAFMQREAGILALAAILAVHTFLVLVAVYAFRASTRARRTKAADRYLTKVETLLKNSLISEGQADEEVLGILRETP